MSLAARRPRRPNVSMPKRYTDLLPQAAPSLPPTGFRPPTPPPPLNTADAHPPSLHSRVSRFIRTPRNIFGLVRQYFGAQLPAVDPEEHLTLADISSAAPRSSTPRSKWSPFPNKSSFLLGAWHWNGGTQKSQSGFKDLIDIVGDPSFHPEDVRNTKWNKVFSTLGDGGPDDEEVDGEWLDVDAGWRKKHVEITVPFHQRMQTPGTTQFICGELYHRSLVEVIRERISDPHTAPQIHLEPYELLWKRSNQHDEVKLHGEVYTSEAFREAHDALQNSPPEPGCNLQRVVVALMFWSDATHLTQFGSSQLWPCYMAMGNESKYRRCKPSCNLCSHVAYFRKVSKGQFCRKSSILTHLGSYQTNSPSLQLNALAEKVPKRPSLPTVAESVSMPKWTCFLTTSLLKHGSTV